MPIETSLIIVTLDRAALLRETLASLEKQTHALDEIVIVDNGPSLDTQQAVQSFRAKLPVRYFPEPRRGYGLARNRGLDAAQGRTLLFLDDDCLAEPTWAQRLLASLDTGETEIAGGSRTCIRSGLAAYLDYLSSDAPVLHPGRKRGYASHLSTSNLALRRETADAVGRFDEKLTMCEDRDFCARARERGFRILYEPTAIVHHQPPILRMGHYFRKMRHYGVGTSEYFLRHRNQEPLARLLPRSAALRLGFLPALAVLGAGYLVWKNLRHQPLAIALSPFLLAGQVCWHWGGYQAMRRESLSC